MDDSALNYIANDFRSLMHELQVQRDEKNPSIDIHPMYYTDGISDDLVALRNQMLDNFLDTIVDIYEGRIVGKN